MESVKVTEKKRHPKEYFWNISHMFYCWTIPIFAKGLKKDLTEDDLFQNLNEHESNNLANKVERACSDQLLHNKQLSLWKAIWTIFKWDFVEVTAIFFFTELVFKLCRPLALGVLLGYYQPNQEDISKNYAIAAALFIVVASFVDSILDHAFIIKTLEIGMKVRVACSSLIYRKALKLDKSALNHTTVGQIINLLSNDVAKLRRICMDINAVWSIPVQTIIVLYLLQKITGSTSLTGAGFLFLVLPIQMFVSKKTSVYRLKIAKTTDERIRCMNEIITGIQVIKTYTWERPFIKLIELIRRKEVKLIRIFNYLEASTTASGLFLDRTAIFLCILTYVLTGNRPGPQYVFVVSAFYELLMGSLSMYLPHAFAALLQANVAVQRIQNFLNLSEVEHEVKRLDHGGVKIEKLSAKWPSDLEQNALSDINFTADQKELVAIIGPIGSGKTSLLQLCLNELNVTKGGFDIGGRISYAPQEPWLFGGTVRQNILFGEKMLRDKYDEVLRVCALQSDIEQFPFGDNTVVGERGILLSGGQKARINLARAVYRDADIYLLDDPLSAVDARVGKRIFNDCIRNYLRNKCTILVTHQIQYLATVDKIYLMEDGKIVVSGSYADVKASGEHFTKLLQEKDRNEVETEHQNAQVTEVVANEKQGQDDKEMQDFGKISSAIYATYMKSGTSCFNAIFVLVLFGITEFATTGADYFIAFWVNLEQKRMAFNATNATEDMTSQFFSKEVCIYFYSSIIGAVILLSFIRSLNFIRICMRASVKLHQKMFTSIVNASMKFFYRNSSGRILNRFSKDIGNMDETLPEVFMDSLQLTLAVVGTTLAICIVNPWTIIPTVAIFVVMYLIRIVYLSSSLNLKRIEGTTRSPIFAHVTESMKGLTVIRAFGVAKILEKEFDNIQNVNNSAFYMFLGCNRAFATWLDIVCVFYVSFVTIIALINETYGGNVGFIVTQAMSLTGMFQWAIRQWSELENQMTSIERIVEYTQIEHEVENEQKPPENWPDQGEIRFDSVFMQYSATEPFVIKNFKFSIKPREKIGIVGRTGAGKSSLISVLFRLVEFEGAVYIDGVNTKTISLSALRSKISLIPQEPILFSGSIRKNLDPFDEYPDEQIWNALADVEMKQFVAEQPLTIHTNLAEGGSNLSVGQKQLLCLARAALKNNRILILDEATANVDPQTDQLLQKTIKERFMEATVLTIAHRLHTVMDSDKILVIDEGYVVEFDHPHTLLQRKQALYSLVMETGRETGENLAQIAKENYHNHMEK